MTAAGLRHEADPLPLGPTGLPVVPARDIALGWPLGSRPPRRPTRADPDPVRALRDALRPALLRPPCVLAFSGGRDSSLLLAVAADLARREGLAPPIAFTFRYPGDPAADESWWQELVVSHLRRHGHRLEWVRRDITDELDIIGPVVAPVLRAHGGPTFPAALGSTILLTRFARRGSLVTGNAGDEVLGGHRAGVLRAVLRRRCRRMTRDDWWLALASAAPAAVRFRMMRREVAGAPWLRPELRRAALREALHGEAGRPLRWAESVWSAVSPRAVLIGGRSKSRIAADHDCRLVEPLGAEGFVASYAAFGGRFGGLTRSGGTGLLAAGLLPEAIIRRRRKAWFNASRFGPVSRRFAETWDGRGVDESLVDPALLRAAWLAGSPPATTAMLLQQAWLAGAR